MNQPRSLQVIHRVLALMGGLFGIVTIIAGTRVLAGSDPGHVVYLPLLIFNVVMGITYVCAGIVAWYSLDRGRYAAGLILVLNFLVLLSITLLHQKGGEVAVESVRAMTFRTVFWLVIFAGLWWGYRRFQSDRLSQ